MVVPTKSSQRCSLRVDREAYRERNRVERAISRLKRFGRMATRYEKRAVNDHAMVIIAAIMDWL